MKENIVQHGWFELLIYKEIWLIKFGNVSQLNILVFFELCLKRLYKLFYSIYIFREFLTKFCTFNNKLFNKVLKTKFSNCSKLFVRHDNDIFTTMFFSITAVNGKTFFERLPSHFQIKEQSSKLISSTKSDFFQNLSYTSVNSNHFTLLSVANFS